MNNYKPPFQITEKMTVLIGEISEEIGRMSIFQEKISNPHLRRENRIKTIHSSLAIEHNSLSLEQVTAILDGNGRIGYWKNVAYFTAWEMEKNIFLASNRGIDKKRTERIL